MQPNLIAYLKKDNGTNLESIMKSLSKVDERSRFDEKRFDILAYNNDEKRFYGLKAVQVMDYEILSKIVDDAAWFKRYGTTMVLMPPELSSYRELFDETMTSMLYYYSGKEYHFVKDESELKTGIELKMENALKTLSHPAMVDSIIGSALDIVIPVITKNTKAKTIIKRTLLAARRVNRKIS